jgi:serine protease inhibitor
LDAQLPKMRTVLHSPLGMDLKLYSLLLFVWWNHTGLNRVNQIRIKEEVATMHQKTGGVFLVSLIGLTLLLLYGGGCALLGSESLAAPVEELDQRLTDANNDLGINLFQELSKAAADENLFISPSSIITALAMTYGGADGETQRAMGKTLQLEDMSLEEVNAAFADLLTILQNPDPKVELAVANSLWARAGVDFYEEFLKLNQDYFQAEVNALDFDDPSAAETINKWVRSKTGEKIESIVEPPINPDTILFLINAIYFKGEWTEPFDAELTRDIPFNLPGGTKKNHPTMFRFGSYRYLENELFQAVSLPYGKNERISMYIFLPAQGTNLENFNTELSPANWKRWLDSFGNMEGELGLPRFKFEYETSLNDTLVALGMGPAFDEATADFSKMRPVPPRLYISDVKHKTFVEVNEEGTEAAAATSVEISVTSMPETFSMIVDRPFFFTIVDDLTGTILFMGSVSEPLL